MENLKALVYKGNSTTYQRALAQREFEGIVERLEIYEKAVKNNAVLPVVVERSEQVKCRVDNKFMKWLAKEAPELCESLYGCMREYETNDR